jgi:type VI secretion system protein
MGRERSLLDRLDDPRPNAPRRIEQSTEELADSVLAHLQRMLNTRQGNCLTLEDYGIPDFTDMVHSFPEAVGRMQRAIRQSIERYEPRLRRVRVTPVEDPDDVFRLRFEITGELVTADEQAAVWFETTISPSGRISVRG